MLFGIIVIIIGIANVLVGAFTDWHYEWFTTRWQKRFIGKTASRIEAVIAGILCIFLGIFFIAEGA